MINTVCGIGSTGRICTDIATYLHENNHECIIAYGQGNTQYSNSYKIGKTIENHFHNIGSRVLGLQGYFTKNGTRKLIEKIREENPDIIHLHNLHGNYLNLELLFDFLKDFKGKIFWTLHDCWAYTGKCAHYTDVKCFKWKEKCSICPQVNKYPPSMLLDQSEKMFFDKKRWYSMLPNLHVICVSDWLKNEAKQSLLLGEHRIERVYNWIDYETFHFIEGSVKEKLNLPEEKKIVLCVSAAWNKSDEKFKKLLQLSDVLDDDYLLLVVGKINSKVKKKNIAYIPYVTGKEKMAEIYSVADVYLHLSTEDTFGLVIGEAMACGTPVVVFNSTACSEIVGSVECGSVVENNDIMQIVNKISEIVDAGKQSYSEKCRNYVMEKYDINKNINLLLTLYLNKYVG